MKFTVDKDRHAKLRRAIGRLAEPARRWVSLDFFTAAEIASLTELAQKQAFRTAQAEIKHKANSVFQDFEVCFPAPRMGVFDALATCLEINLIAAAADLPKTPFSAPFRFDDFAIQRYAPGSRGIGIHRDGKRYKHIVVIITLAGQSRLFSTETRDGLLRKKIDDRPGRLVLLSADGFLDRHDDDARPLHGVDRVFGGRLSVGLRSFG